MSLEPRVVVSLVVGPSEGVVLETTSAYFFMGMEVFYLSDKGWQKTQDRGSAFFGDDISGSKQRRDFQQSGLWGTRG